MIFRPIELALDPGEQLGFTIGSFTWRDGSFHTLLGLIYNHKDGMLYASVAFVEYVWQFLYEDDEEDDY